MKGGIGLALSPPRKSTNRLCALPHHKNEYRTNRRLWRRATVLGAWLYHHRLLFGETLTEDVSRPELLEGGVEFAGYQPGTAEEFGATTAPLSKWCFAPLSQMGNRALFVRRFATRNSRHRSCHPLNSVWYPAQRREQGVLGFTAKINLNLSALPRRLDVRVEALCRRRHF